jgi:choline-sulfatase
MAAHRMVTKQVALHEEVTRVPFVFAGPGVEGCGRSVEEPLVSLLDLMPTLLECAGIDPPDGLAGRSVLPWLAGGRTDGHDRAVSTWHTEWGYTLSPGRMLRTRRWKYTRYLEGDGEELFDLESDPGEKASLIGDPRRAGVLEEHRALLARHLEETGDPFFGYSVEVDPRWRSHRLGYRHHTGPAAPSADGE